jgi:hypothetical protein
MRTVLCQISQSVLSSSANGNSQMMEFGVMKEEAARDDEEDTLIYEVSDDELEVASGGRFWGPTMVSSGTIGAPFFCC